MELRKGWQRDPLAIAKSLPLSFHSEPKHGDGWQHARIVGECSLAFAAYQAYMVRRRGDVEFEYAKLQFRVIGTDSMGEVWVKL